MKKPILSGKRQRDSNDDIDAWSVFAESSTDDFRDFLEHHSGHINLEARHPETGMTMLETAVYRALDLHAHALVQAGAQGAYELLKTENGRYRCALSLVYGCTREQLVAFETECNAPEMLSERTPFGESLGVQLVVAGDSVIDMMRDWIRLSGCDSIRTPMLNYSLEDIAMVRGENRMEYFFMRRSIMTFLLCNRYGHRYGGVHVTLLPLDIAKLIARYCMRRVDFCMECKIPVIDGRLRINCAVCEVVPVPCPDCCFNKPDHEFNFSCRLCYRRICPDCRDDNLVGSGAVCKMCSDGIKDWRALELKHGWQ